MSDVTKKPSPAPSFEELSVGDLLDSMEDAIGEIEDNGDDHNSGVLRHLDTRLTQLRAALATRPSVDVDAERSIDRLAQFIMDEYVGEPSRSEGAVDTAIRIMRADRERIRLLAARTVAPQDAELELRIKRIVHRVVTDRNVVVRTNNVVEDVEALARGETIDWPNFEEWCQSYEKRGYR